MIDSTNQQIWRWNVDDTWLSFSSMFQEACISSSINDESLKYHHQTAAILFGVCSVESFMNKAIRKKMTVSETNEDVIIKTLKNLRLKDKLIVWPEKINIQQIPKEHLDIFFEFFYLRHEITHRKRVDHSLYKELEETNIGSLVKSIQYILVHLYCNTEDTFPYWLLGWNYVGINFDKTKLCLINNQQFHYSLQRFGFNVPAASYYHTLEWDKQFMSSINGFSILKDNVHDKCPDIEPQHPVFPKAPRLTKRWWDKIFLKDI